MTQAQRAGWIARMLLAIAAALVAGSVWLPYWSMRVFAPQYPKGLELVVYPNRLAGDVREIDTLNHYIGMRPLEHGAVVERRLALWGIGVVVCSLIVAAWMPSRWAWLGIVPVACLPLLFAGDLWWWLSDYGLHLNPKAPLSRAVKPFIPPLFGQGKIAQFDVVAGFGYGFWLAVAAGLLAWYAVRLKARTRGHARAAVVLTAGLAILWPGPDAAAQTWHVGGADGVATIQEAADRAADGDTIVVRPGRYAGPLVVRRRVALIGQDGAVVDGGGRGTVVALEAPGITMAGFTIRGSGDILSAEHTGILVRASGIAIEGNRLEDVLFGVHLRHAPGSVVRRNVFRGKPLPVARRGDAIRVWYSDDVTIEGNQVFDGRDVVLWYSTRLTIRGNEVRRGRYGLHFMYCHDAVVEGNHLEENSVGAYLMYSAGLQVRGNRMLRHRGPSGYGLGLKDMEAVRVERNTIADNRVGIFLEHASGSYEDDTLALNDTGVWVWPSARQNRFERNAFIENGEQVRFDGAQADINSWQQNFWSDYRGYDADGDGLGDVPYRGLRLFERLTDRYPALRLYTGSPVAQALDVAAQMFPVFAPRPVLMDPKPLMRVGPADVGAG